MLDVGSGHRTDRPTLAVCTAPGPMSLPPRPGYPSRR